MESANRPLHTWKGSDEPRRDGPAVPALPRRRRLPLALVRRSTQSASQVPLLVRCLLKAQDALQAMQTAMHAAEPALEPAAVEVNLRGREHGTLDQNSP